MYVLGKSGTGKSVLLENMIIQNIVQGEGVCVVDPHGELVEKILETIPKERVNDVVYFNPADTDHNIGFNVLQLDDPRYKHLVASGLMGIFTKIWANAWSSRMEYILNNTILALLDTPDTTLLGIPRMLVDKDYRQYIINNLKDPVVKAFWVHEYEAWRDQFRNEAIAPIQNKVGQFLSSNIVRNVVGQTRSTINVFDIMNTKKIFLINVSKGRIGEDNSALLGGMLITKLQLSAMERVRIPEQQREDFYLYVDEFQNFVTDSFASILSEARKYRLNLTIAHQYIAQLETADSKTVKDAVFGNVGTMIIFRVGADDADALEKEFEPEFTVEDFVNLPNYHIYTKLMVDGVTSRPFSARTLPPVPVQSSDEIRDMVIEASRENYTRKRVEVEAEIQKWSSTVPGQTRADGEETEGKFKATCSNCGKDIYVPFEPEPGRPIYCKECLFKIKNGEIQAAAGFRPPKEKRDNVSYDALAALGIEFGAETKKPDRPNFAPTARPSGPPRPMYKPPQIPDGPDMPPGGMIRADSREIPSPKVLAKASEAVAADKPRDMSVPPPRVVRAPIRKERKGPDTSGLQSLLKDALGGVINSAPVQQKAAPDQAQDKPAAPARPAISLNALKNNNAPQYVVQTKEAQPERQNMLKDAISAAIGEKIEEVKEEARSEKSEVVEIQQQDDAARMEKEKQEQEARERQAHEAEQKLQAERQRLEAEHKEREEKARREMLEKQREEERKLEEARKKMEAEVEAEKKRLALEEEARKKALAEVEAEKKRLAALDEEHKRVMAEVHAKREQERKEAEAERMRLEEELKQKDLHAKELEEEAQRKEEARLKMERELQEKEEQERLEKERILEATRNQPSQEEEVHPKPKKTKEIPEDLLKQILE